MSFEALSFYAFAALALFSALAMVGFVRNTAVAASSLAGAMVSLAGIYVLLDAHFVAVVQILVYVGAIVALFVFVVRSLGLRQDGFQPPRPGAALFRLAGAVAAVAVALLVSRELPATGDLPSPPGGFGGHRAIGASLFGDHVVALDVAGLILLAAVVGAGVLANRRAS